MWQFIYAIPVVQRLRQKDCSVLEGSLNYKVRPVLEREGEPRGREGGKSCLRLCTVNYKANISILTDRLPPLPHLCSTWLREDGLMSWCQPDRIPLWRGLQCFHTQPCDSCTQLSVQILQLGIQLLMPQRNLQAGVSGLSEARKHLLQFLADAQHSQVLATWLRLQIHGARL